MTSDYANISYKPKKPGISNLNISGSSIFLKWKDFKLEEKIVYI